METRDLVLRPQQKLYTQEEVDRLLNAKQARIDELMLEYCPDEITDEQWEEYQKHQVTVNLKDIL